MIIKTCDRCGKEIPIENLLMPMVAKGRKLHITVDKSTYGENGEMNIQPIDLCEVCDNEIYKDIFLSRD